MKTSIRHRLMKRRDERGATIFVVVLVLGMLTGIGLFAAQASSIVPIEVIAPTACGTCRVRGVSVAQTRSGIRVGIKGHQAETYPIAVDIEQTVSGLVKRRCACARGIVPRMRLDCIRWKVPPIGPQCSWSIRTPI